MFEILGLSLCVLVTLPEISVPSALTCREVPALKHRAEGLEGRVLPVAVGTAQASESRWGQKPARRGQGTERIQEFACQTTEEAL